MTGSIYKLYVRVFYNPFSRPENMPNSLLNLDEAAEKFIPTNTVKFIEVEYKSFLREISKFNIYSSNVPEYVIIFPEITCLETLLYYMRFVRKIKEIVDLPLFYLFKISRLSENSKEIDLVQAKNDDALSKILYPENKGYIKFHSEVVTEDVHIYSRDEKRIVHNYYIGGPQDGFDILSLFFILRLFRYPNFVNRILRVFSSKHVKEDKLFVIMKAILRMKWINLHHGYGRNDNFYYALFLYRTLKESSFHSWATGDFNGICTKMMYGNFNYIALRLLNEPFMTDFKVINIPEEYAMLYWVRNVNFKRKEIQG